jgi:hypothetical protein
MGAASPRRVPPVVAPAHEESSARGEPLAVEGKPVPRADDGVPLRDPGPIDSHQGPVHPHPITPGHVSIQRENALIGAMNDAMAVSDGPRLQALLGTYRAEYPDDPQQLQAGYQVIVACLEHPGAESRADAQRYDDEHRGSTLRRFVRRHCLDR